MSRQYDPNKHHRHSIRLKGWDYSSVGLYFVTICTHNRQNLFDDPRLREIATNAWNHIPEQAHAKHVVLDEAIFMEDHLHGIIGLTTPEDAPRDFTTLQPGSVGAIVGNYKMLVAKRVKAMLKMGGTDFKVWQRGYYERIIRNERELNAIRSYIQENPIRHAEKRDDLDKLFTKMNHINTEQHRWGRGRWSRSPKIRHQNLPTCLAHLTWQTIWSLLHLGEAVGGGVLAKFAGWLPTASPLPGVF
ncbi:transposase [Candidatus Leptofilum sp.]|uniref:transposase n=1 Tax=Candidatus Leptofilum sp. TaxID=3241576 RepID=UPI003B59E74B